MAGWERVEAMARDLGLSGGLEARVADPLWLLARQWQTGEVHGEDAAQPAVARITGRSVPLVSFQTDAAAAEGARPQPRPLPAGVPLETLVEGTTPPDFGGAHLHASARAGRRLIRLLREAGLAAGADALMGEFRLAPPDHAVGAGALDRAAIELLVRHGLDGAAVAAASQARVREVLAGALSGPDLDEAENVVAGWRAWYQDRSGAPGGGGAWDEQRLGYAFSVAAAGPRGEVTLVARDHHGGHLDWPVFDLATAAAARRLAHGLGRAEVPVRTRTAVPAPVRYAGMPASRFWEFEDGEVHFGDVDAGPADLARLLVAEFATVYGRDWFVVPIQVDLGTLTELTSVEVIDTFGGHTSVPSTAMADAPKPGGRRAWRLFELTGDEVGDEHPSPWLLVPPTVVGATDGPAVERVAFARDETANLAWGIEHLVEGPLGRAVDRTQAWAAPETAGAPAPASAPAGPGDRWRYRLEATAPPWWVPLLPERIHPDAPEGDEAAQVRLRRARMQAWALLATGPAGAVAGPASAVLDPRRPRWLAEEEVPRAGVQVERAWQLARWHDGSLHLWHRHRVTPGRGEASSGVRWDLLDRDPGTRDQPG